MTHQLTPYLDLFDGVWFLANEAGTLREWSRPAVETTGYADGDLKSMTLAELTAARDADATSAAVAEALESASGHASADVALVTTAGREIPYELRVRRLPDDSDSDAAVVVVATAQAVGEHELRKEMTDRMSDGFLALDTEWRITHRNEAASAMLTEAAERDQLDGVEGMSLWEMVPEAVDTAFYSRFHAAMATQEVVTFEEYYEPLDTWFDVRAYPSDTGLSVFFRDVTDSHRRREALEHREQVLREMYDVIADRERPFEAQVTALLELGREEIDTAYGTLSRIDGEEYVFEVVDADDDSIQAGDVVPLSATNCELAASTEQTLVLGDIERDAPEETERAGYAEWGISCYIGAPVFVDDEVYGTFCFYDQEARDGQFSEWEVTLVDLMTRWVSYELQREQVNEMLERQNERLERFASVISHDLRSPLSVLEGRLTLAEKTGDSAEFDHCRTAINRMDELIDDLLAVARAGAVIDERESVPLDTVLASCWRTVSAPEATLRIETDMTVEADESRLRQLVENLFRNSVEHGRPDVTITVGPLDDGFFVADDGPGISEEDREAVFETGYSTSEDGAGFGLAIVREVAEAHGWDVTITASETGGARLEFTGVTGDT